MPEDTPTASPPALPPSPLDKINDFSDRLSPMLVKELRQGMRTNTFVILFLLLQAFLMLILLATSAVDNSNSGEFISGIIFSFFSLAVLVVQPLRGITAISGEIKGDTIDLMSLTGLSAWRIAYGKWTSIMGQSALFLLAIIPYLILRYFFGGMQLFAELFLLFSIFVASGVLTAFTIGLSTFSLALIRVLPLIGGCLLFFLIFGIAFSELDEVLALFSPSSGEHWLGLLAGYFIAIYVGYFFLDLAATAIAPASENRATRKRLIGWGVILASFAILHPIDSDTAWILASFLMILISFDLYSENQEYPSIVLRPFLRFGFFGKILSRFLAPGWATGTLAFLAIICSLALVHWLKEGSFIFSDPDILIPLGVMFGITQFPVMLINLFQKRLKDRLTTLVLSSTLLLLLIPLFGIIEDLGGNDSLMSFFCFIPYAQPFLPRSMSDETSLLIIWASTLTYVLINLVFAFPHLRKLGKLEKEEIENLAAHNENRTS